MRFRFLGTDAKLYAAKKRAAFLSLFTVFLVYFVWNSAWHLPSQLVILGYVEHPVEVWIGWDSGSGYNHMASADVIFGQPDKNRVRSGIIKVRRVGGRHPSAKSDEVWISAIRRSQDDRPMELRLFAKQKGIEVTREGYLHLLSNGTELQIPAGKKYTIFHFIADESSGFVEIDLDGDKRLYDLYSAQHQGKRVERKQDGFMPGSFSVKVDLPRYDIQRLQILSQEPLQMFRLESVRIVSKNGELKLPFWGDGLRSSVVFSDFSRNTRTYFHPIHFLQQVLFALLSAWLVVTIFRFIRIRGGIPRVLCEGKRPAFWLMFAGGWFVLGAWLLVYWPGHFTTDSIHIWWAAKQPGYFMHDHPVMNILFYRFLQQFWDHFAVVGIAQILLTSLLGAYIFYWLYKKGAALYILLPFYGLFLASIPIGLYTITLWKDIPFALLVLFWSFWLMKLTVEKKEGKINHSWTEIITLSFLLIALGFFRYNGVVYFMIIPAGLAILGIISRRKFLIGAVGMLILVSAFLSTTIILDKNHFVSGQSRFFINRMLSFGFGETAWRMIRQYPTLLDINIYKKRAIWYDTWYRDSNVTNWHYGFAREKGYSPWIRYIPCEPKSNWLYGLLHPLNLLSATEPRVYFTWNPFYMLFIFPICFLYRLFPSAAAFSYVVLSQVFVLLLVLGPFNYNWRYYYFLYISLFFLVPVIALDVRSLPRRFPGQERKGG